MERNGVQQWWRGWVAVLWFACVALHCGFLKGLDELEGERSNVETTFMMVKTKFGDKLKSKKWIAQKNELLCKLIAHNIVVVIHEMHELGINPDFSTYTSN